MGRPPKAKSVEPSSVVEPEAPAFITITNDKPGTTLHLGDGRRLAFGESGDVPAYLAGAFNG